MKKISINNIIKFRYKAEKNRKTFIKSLERKAEVKTEGGGNYWGRSLSALSNAINHKDNTIIKEKIDEILGLLLPGLLRQTKDMYQRNINILHNYENVDFSNWLPNEFKILSKSNKKTTIHINAIPVQITPSQIFSFEENGNEYIGAIWFVAQLNGYRQEELGMFAEALFIYLTNNFDEKFQISPQYCIVVDISAQQEVNYKNLIDEEVPAILEATLELIKEQL
ncbi:MAG: hypothetical protein ACT6QS_11600 [Flavobacteriales bacterium]